MPKTLRIITTNKPTSPNSVVISYLIRVIDPNDEDVNLFSTEPHAELSNLFKSKLPSDVPPLASDFLRGGEHHGDLFLSPGTSIDPNDRWYDDFEMTLAKIIGDYANLDPTTDRVLLIDDNGNGQREFPFGDLIIGT